jgi:methylenetetrahydrofolate reductase (NADPH)
VTYDAAASTRVDGCPKRMVFGPCGGVRFDGSCEMQPAPCVFDSVVPWPGPRAVTPPVAGPRVLTDFTAPPFDRAAARNVAAVLAPTCDAVLVGEHQNRPDFPPTVLASLLLEAGAVPWITLACRDRNRVILEQELRGLLEVGVGTTLCVTGDGRGYDVRPEVTQVFDLDGPRLAALAADHGLTAAVPETPTAPPSSARPRRLVSKQHAGASVAVLNHVPEVADLAEFMRAARAAGLRIPVVAGVAVFTDAVSARVLTALPGLHVDPARVTAVLDADDPVQAGIDAAVAEAHAVLAIDGVTGVNLSGSASSVSALAGAEIKAEIGRRLLADSAR